MGQQWTTWILVMSILLVLLYFGGMITTPPTLLKIMLDPTGPEFIILGIELIAAFSAATVLAKVNLGFLSIQNSDITITAAFMIIIYNTVQGFWQVYETIAAVAPVVAVLVMSPMILMFIFIIFDFWRGRD